MLARVVVLELQTLQTPIPTTTAVNIYPGLDIAIRISRIEREVSERRDLSGPAVSGPYVQ